MVRCIGNSGKDLPLSCLDSRAGIDRDTEFPASVGSSYIVYALTVYLSHIWYYILDDNNLPYPIWKPGPLFEISDGRIPDGWTIAYYRPHRGNEYPVTSFPEWSEDPSFYERLVEGDGSAREVFEMHRRAIDAQHAQ